MSRSRLARISSNFAARRDGFDDVAFATAAIGFLARSYGIDTSRVYAVGFSAGGAMVIRLAHEIPTRLAGAAIISETQPVPENFMLTEAPPSALPVVLIHGTGDPLVPYEGGMASLWGFQPRGLGLSARQTAAYYAERNGITQGPKSRQFAGAAESGKTWVERTDYRQDGHEPVTLYTRPPRFDPLTAKVAYKRGSPLTVELTVHPWVPAETVLENYRKIQRQLLGKENHRLKSRSLEVVRFVENRIRQKEGVRPPWRKLMERWNEGHSAEERFLDLRNFVRVYKDTLERVAHYSFYLPRRKPLSPAAKRKRDKKVAEAEAFKHRFSIALEAHKEKHGNRWSEER